MSQWHIYRIRMNPNSYKFYVYLSRARSFYICVLYRCVTGSFLVYMRVLYMSRAHSFYICVFYICVRGSFLLYMRMLYMCHGLIPSIYVYSIYVSRAHSFYIWESIWIRVYLLRMWCSSTPSFTFQVGYVRDTHLEGMSPWHIHRIRLSAPSFMPFDSTTGEAITNFTFQMW